VKMLKNEHCGQADQIRSRNVARSAKIMKEKMLRVGNPTRLPKQEKRPDATERLSAIGAKSD